MKSSVWKVRRKWPFRGLFCDQRAMVTVAVLLAASPAAQAATAIPLPQPRPAEAPSAVPRPADAPAAAEAPAPMPSACRLALTDAVAVAPSIPPITGPGGCGGGDLVRLEAVVLPDGQRVAVKPAATLRCSMAAAIADWIRVDMTPLAEGLGSRVSELDNFDSFECRGRNRVAGAKLSEHGKANALDVRGLRLASGQFIGLTDRAVTRDLREKVMGSVCARFTTVLGPGSDGYHEDHIHLDLAERHNGYRICHWEIYDLMPAIAPLLPAERPPEAPPREIAEEALKSPEPPRAPAAEPPAPAQAVPAVKQGAAPEPPKTAPATRGSKASATANPAPPSAAVSRSRSAATKSPKRRRKPPNGLPLILRPLFN